MSDNKLVIRGDDVIHPPVKTSLSDFINKASIEEVVEETIDETSDDAETTESEDASDSVLDDSESKSEESDAVGTEADEQVFEVKGNKVPLKDLINAFETREEISRRFAEVGHKEKKIIADKERAKKEREELDFINEKFEEMHELVLQGNPLAALQIALNMNPKESSQPKAMKELIEQAVTIAENYQAMDEDERKLFLDKEELSVRERNLKRTEDRKKIQEAEEELKTYYNSVLDSNKVTDPEIELAMEDINKLPKFKEEFEKKTDPKERIQYATSWVLGKRINNTILEGINLVDKELAKDDTFRLALLDHISPQSTKEDVAAIVREYKKPSVVSAKSESGALTKDVTKVTTPNKAPTGKPKVENKKPITNWADLVAKHSA